ncbi:MAG: hypothetical protein LBD96_02755 [Treponema sp.]|jgi:uncharacterized integral membrane protein|nr:hypothetical protein [Treponema sp.]
MPWRLIGVVLLGAVFLFFIGFNLENRCDISLGFFTFSQVPVFLTALSAFMLGLFLALPLVVSFRFGNRRKKKTETPAGKVSRKKREKTAGTAESGVSAGSPPPDGDYGIQ